MATLVLGVVGSAVGNALLPAGLSILGTTIAGATIGGAIGSAVGSVIDSALVGPKKTQVEGPRLSELKLQTSTEGAPIQRVFGSTRVGGQIIWATDFKETKKTTTQSSGGKATSSPSVKTEVTEYFYSVSFAVGLAEGRIDRIGRVWADGKPLNLASFTVRIYKGDEDQLPDALIEAIEGAGTVPAYRGLSYVVFEDMALERFGNRVPQLSFEIIRSVAPSVGDSLEQLVSAVDVIPGSGEFVYSTDFVVKDYGDGVTVAETMNNTMGAPDFTVAMDMLEDQLPNCGAVALVVTWFGNDLRCDHVVLKPGVELAAKDTFPFAWSAGGIARGSAHVVSQVDGRPAFGGTPSDRAVVQAIADLKARGLRVLFYPFVMLDIAAGNALPDPYDPMGTQAVYPWRGRITCDPAPGVAGSPDKTAAAASQIATFFGAADPGDFSVAGTTVSYSGPSEWSLRRMILHYAHLCAAADGVDAFLISSELKGLTSVRSAAGVYPAVAALQALAGDVSAILPDAKISYAADWSEYFGHQPADGSGDVYFQLDPLWADADIDFIAIDSYLPLSDWRDGTAHLDRQAGTRSIYDVTYLKSNIEGGEGFDWYYASPADRDSQTRTPVSDGAYDKPWVFRFKDWRNWWLNEHFDRPDGVEAASPTGWVPQSKPIWITEVGCPAVNKGANQPNVFVDPKSSESNLPYFSNGRRDDLMQRRYLEAIYAYWTSTANPVSSVYAAAMIDPANIYAWTWDARPYPDFPLRTDFWSDGDNWQRGHWLTGRVGQVPLPDLVTAIAAEVGLDDVDAGDLTGLVGGYVIDRIMSPRAAIEPLMLAYQFDAVESEGVIKFVPRGGDAAATLASGDFVAGEDTSLFRLTRAQETELPLAAKITFIAPDTYRQATVESRRLTVQSDRVATAELAIVMDEPSAQSAADTWLMDTWVQREEASFALPPSKLALDPGDVVTLDTGGATDTYRLSEITDELSRATRAVRTETSLYDGGTGARRTRTLPPTTLYGPAQLYFLDLPLITGGEVPYAPHAAAFADPWAGAVDVFRSATDDNFVLNRQLTIPATLGRTLYNFYAGPAGRWDRGNLVRVVVVGGELASTDALSLLNGANLAAVMNEDGEWELFQFQTATLIDDGVYDLSMLLRGQAGTDGAMRDPVAAGAPFVLIDAALSQLSFALNERGIVFNWRYGPRGAGLGDFSVRSETRAFAGLGLRPLAPAHVRLKRETSNDVTMTWIRRTRIGGDTWGESDAPLGEAMEAYEIDVMSGSTVKRTLNAAAPTATYTSAEQTADFGSPPSSLTVRVHQLSDVFGRGAAKEVTRNV